MLGLEAVWAFLEATAVMWGYPGVFLASLLGSATIILPVPSFLVVIALSRTLNPLLLGLVAAVGAALGELTGYAIGKGGELAIRNKYEKSLETANRWAQRHGMFTLLVLFAMTPAPDDLLGILAGVIGYDLKKFLLASFIGKAILYVGVALLGFYGLQMIEGDPFLTLITNELFLVALLAVFGILAFNILHGPVMKRLRKK